MTVSNVVSPLMVTFDRFLIGALISVTAVAYYATPFEVVTKLLIIPGALVGVMFPAFSTSFAQDRDRTALLYGRSVKYNLLILFPIILLIMVLAANGLKLWLGPEFAQHSARVLQWLALGVFMNSLAYVPFALVQGAGRPDLTAKLHLIELPCYLLALWWLIHVGGIEGAAIVWTARVTIDAVVLFIMARQVLQDTAHGIKVVAVAAIAALAVLLFTTALTSLPAKASFAGVLIAAFAVYGWFVMLTPKERARVQSRLRPQRAL
jgi:O-antigen/teichoic acid export membrane protein